MPPGPTPGRGTVHLVQRLAGAAERGPGAAVLLMAHPDAVGGLDPGAGVDARDDRTLRAAVASPMVTVWMVGDALEALVERLQEVAPEPGKCSHGFSPSRNTPTVAGPPCPSSLPGVADGLQVRGEVGRRLARAGALVAEPDEVREAAVAEEHGELERPGLHPPRPVEGARGACAPGGRECMSTPSSLAAQRTPSRREHLHRLRRDGALGRPHPRRPRAEVPRVRGERLPHVPARVLRPGEARRERQVRPGAARRVAVTDERQDGR